MDPIAETTDTDADGAADRPPSKPIVELRQCQLQPSQSTFYAERVQTSPLRDGLPLAFFGIVETGSMPLDTAVHLYHYPGGHAERREKRTALAADDGWDECLSEVRPCMMRHSSETYVEADLVEDFEEISGLEPWAMFGPTGDGSGTIVELRRYQLKLGYSTKFGDTLEAFLLMYKRSLPSKLNAEGVHPTTQLVTVLVSKTGSVNTVYEVWKHGGHADGEDANCCGWQAMEQSAQASAGTIEWRMVLAELVESVDITALKPLPFSPLK